ncbi:MAG: ABC transporter permease [Candidatus Adiutrix sp.]|jgi:putative ABC transport system permease protein|nr:ABC transporter permease [Candidatus Adiutrix sp.]
MSLLVNRESRLGMMRTRNLRLVWSVLRQHKMRTMLAALGIFLGALLLTGILHVLEAVNLKINEEAIRLGSRLITVTPSSVAFVRPDLGSRYGAREMENENAAIVNASQKSTAAAQDNNSDSARRIRYATLTRTDVSVAISGIPQINNGAPFVFSDGKAGNGLVSSACQLLGTTHAFPGLKHIYPLTGRFFSPAEEERKELVCVLGAALAARLYADPRKVTGSYVEVGKTRLRIIGVMEEKGMDPGGLRLDEMLIMPLATYSQRFSKLDSVGGAWFEVSDRAQMEGAQAALAALLRKRHALPEGELDLVFSLSQEVDEMVVNALSLIRTLGVIGALISFAIGSLSILSVMTLLVRSRRLEIGLRRAVGASRKDIMAQFMAEAALIAAAGGFTGVAAGLGMLRAAGGRQRGSATLFQPPAGHWHFLALLRLRRIGRKLS